MKSVSVAAAVAVIACVAAATSACLTSAGRRGEPFAPPFVASNPAVVRGELLFARHCDQCHPGGEAGLGPAINNDPTPAVAIKAQVRLGVGAMPGFTESRLSASELDDLVSFVLAFRRSERPRD